MKRKSKNEVDKVVADDIERNTMEKPSQTRKRKERDKEYGSKKAMQL